MDQIRATMLRAWARLNRSHERQQADPPRPGRPRDTGTPVAAHEAEALGKPGFAEEALPWMDAVHRFALRLTRVGPTLGAAIALASMGQSMGTAFIVMLAYGVGTAGVLLLAGLASDRVLARWKPTLLSTRGRGKKVLGWTLLALGVMVVTGVDKYLEAAAVNLVPAWVFTL